MCLFLDGGGWLREQEAKSVTWTRSPFFSPGGFKGKIRLRHRSSRARQARGAGRGQRGLSPQRSSVRLGKGHRAAGEPPGCSHRAVSRGGSAPRSPWHRGCPCPPRAPQHPGIAASRSPVLRQPRWERCEGEMAHRDLPALAELLKACQ